MFRVSVEMKHKQMIENFNVQKLNIFFRML
jgi:hypothetical protein